MVPCPCHFLPYMNLDLLYLLVKILPVQFVFKDTMSFSFVLMNENVSGELSLISQEMGEDGPFNKALSPNMMRWILIIKDNIGEIYLKCRCRNWEDNWPLTFHFHIIKPFALTGMSEVFANFFHSSVNNAVSNILFRTFESSFIFTVMRNLAFYLHIYIYIYLNRLHFNIPIIY